MTAKLATLSDPKSRHPTRITLSGVRKKYEGKRRIVALADVNLEIATGQTLRAYLHTCCSIHQPIPPTAMFGRDIRPWKLVELPSVVVVKMCFDVSIFRPPVNGLLMDTKAIRHFLFVQHSPLAKPIVARGEPIGMHQIRDPLGSKAIGASPGSC